MRGRRQNTGVTLIEAVMAVAVLGIALPPIVMLFSEVAAKAPNDTYQFAALGHAQSLLEEIASKAYEDPDEAAGSFGTEEASRAAFDDVDDYHGWSRSPPTTLAGTPLTDHAGFTRSVVVDRVAVVGATPGPVVATGPAAVALANATAAVVTLGPAVPVALRTQDYKRIAVTVAWTGADGGEVTLTTLRTRLESSTGVLDVPASVASATNPNAARLALDLVSATDRDLELESFSLSSDRAAGPLWFLYLASVPNRWRLIWVGWVFLPTPTLPVFAGAPADRVVPAGGAAGAEFLFANVIAPGPITFTLVLNFTSGEQSTLVIPMNWAP